MQAIVTGASGMLGEETVDTFEQRPEWTVVRWRGSSDVDVADRVAVIESALSAKRDLMVHTAAIRDMEACEANPASAMAVNAFGAQNMALAANMFDCPIVHIGTDAVHDGVKNVPYTELDSTNPVNVYGRSKLRAEGLVMAAATRHFAPRVLLLFGARGSRSKNARYKMIVGLRSDQVVRASVRIRCVVLRTLGI